MISGYSNGGMISNIDICPDCGSEELYRSRTRTRGERALRIVLPVHYYRCHSCGWRRPLVNADSWRDWRARVYFAVVPVLLGLLLAGGFLYLALEGTRQVQRPKSSTERSQKKR
jgi:predicted RNA-binding Zn-ribbon protein involved in translation (DUF1610 family)